MQSEDRVDFGPKAAIEHAGIDEALRAAASFFGGLPDELHADRKLARDGFEQSSGADQRCRMPIMPAGVHAAFVRARVGHTCALDDWQRVDIRA